VLERWLRPRGLQWVYVRGLSETRMSQLNNVRRAWHEMT
jgi:hypothetical protein